MPLISASLDEPEVVGSKVLHYRLVRHFYFSFRELKEGASQEYVVYVLSLMAEIIRRSP